MPTYEYECTMCAKVFEVFQPMSARAKRTIRTQCKRCNNRAPVTRRIGSGAGIIFKGSGFYQTDYRSEAYKKAAKAEKESSDGKPTKDAGDASAPKVKESKSKPKPTSAETKDS